MAPAIHPRIPNVTLLRKSGRTTQSLGSSPPALALSRISVASMALSPFLHSSTFSAYQIIADFPHSRVPECVFGRLLYTVNTRCGYAVLFGIAPSEPLQQVDERGHSALRQ